MHTLKTGLMQENLLLFGCFRNVFITPSISEGNQLTNAIYSPVLYGNLMLC